MKDKEKRKIRIEKFLLNFIKLKLNAFIKTIFILLHYFINFIHV